MATKVVEKVITNAELRGMFQATLEMLHSTNRGCIGCPLQANYNLVSDKLQEDLAFAQLFSDVKVTITYTETIEPEPHQRNGTHG